MTGALSFRLRIKLLLSILFILSFNSLTLSQHQASNKRFPKKPNVIYIYADDLGYGELGCYGQQKIETPHLDRIAKEGIRFTQHYTSSPVCAG